MEAAPAAMTIGELARATGVRAGTLRVWESRYGFPAPSRSDGQQRRYPPQTVEQISQVLAERAGGLQLPAAIARARAGAAAEPSLYALIRRRYPALPVHTLQKPQLLALSRAIEDEAASRGRQAVLLGAFQRVRHYRASQRRWENLAGTATAALVFADFPDASGVDRRPREIPIATDQPLGREWVIAVTGPHLAACLIGWEAPGQSAQPDAQRHFDVLWSAERGLVHDLIAAAAALAGDSLDGRGRLLPQLPSAAPGAEDLEATTAITNRMIGYLATTVRSRSSAPPAARRRR